MPDIVIMPGIANYAWVIWLAAFIVCLILEAVTPGSLVSVWLAVGALVAMLCSFGIKSFGVQVVIFLIASFVTFALIRPIAKKHFSSKLEPTNADRLVGETAVVTEAIDNLAAKGQVKVRGQIWTARSVDNTPVAEGALVKVLRLEGVKVIVQVD